MKRTHPIRKFDFWIESLNHRLNALGSTTKINANDASIRKGDLLTVRITDEEYKFIVE